MIAIADSANIQNGLVLKEVNITKVYLFLWPIRSIFALKIFSG